MPSIGISSINSNNFTSLHLHAETKGEYQCYRHEAIWNIKRKPDQNVIFFFYLNKCEQHYTKKHHDWSYAYTKLHQS